MMESCNLLLAGFGGQGILFAGKVVAYAGVMEGREVSWLPSYGPEMRGGTANCSVCLSGKPIGSPLVLTPDVFIAMNQPSYEKFIADVVPGGVVVIDSSLVSAGDIRSDIRMFSVPASKLAREQDLRGLANLIMVGKALQESGFATKEAVFKAIEKSVPTSKQQLVEANKRAIEIGMGM